MLVGKQPVAVGPKIVVAVVATAATAHCVQWVLVSVENGTVAGKKKQNVNHKILEIIYISKS